MATFEALLFANMAQSTYTCDLRLPELYARTVILDLGGEMTWA